MTPSLSGSSFSAPTPRLPRSVRVFRVTLFVTIALVSLVTLFYAEENWRGARAMKAHLRAYTEKGEALDFKSLGLSAVPNEQNFAKTPILVSIVQQGLKKQTDLHDVFSDFLAHHSATTDLGPDNGGAGKDFDVESWLRKVKAQASNHAIPLADSPALEALAMMQPLEKGIAELQAAAQERPLGQFRIFSEDDPSPFEDLSWDQLFTLSKLLGVHANVQLLAGHTKEAFREVCVLQRVASASKEGGGLIGVLVAQAITSSSVSQVMWTGWHQQRWTASQYTSFQNYFATSRTMEPIKYALRLERARVHTLIQQDPEAIRSALSNDSNKLLPDGIVIKFMPRGWLDEYLIRHDDKIQALLSVDLGGRPPHSQLADLNRVNRQAAETARKLTGRKHWYRVDANLGKIMIGSAEQQYHVDQAMIVCALERYRAENGVYPESLAALEPRFLSTLPLDLNTGKSYLYRTTVEGRFILYSPGADEKDDGGNLKTDLVWPMGSAIDAK